MAKPKIKMVWSDAGVRRTKVSIDIERVVEENGKRQFTVLYRIPKSKIDPELDMKAIFMEGIEWISIYTKPSSIYRPLGRNTFYHYTIPILSEKEGVLLRTTKVRYHDYN